MKSFSTFAMFAGLLMFTAAGCGDQAGTSAAPEGGEAAAPAEGADEHGDHDHAEGEHEDGDHEHAEGEGDHEHEGEEGAAEGEEAPAPE